MELKKVIIAPDSFKGALTAQEVADIIGEEFMLAFPSCTAIKMPIADGGEGSLDTILYATGGHVYEELVLSPDDRMIQASYGITNNNEAIIEVAQSSGLTRQEVLHPMTSSTYGFGQLIAAALARGARNFVLCIGGSATTDGGCGMAAALGVKFFNRAGESFVPCGATLKDIENIDMDGLDARIAQSAFTVMCDVENPLFGQNGAAYIYSPQKGADAAQVEELDKGLRHLGAIFLNQFGVDFSDIPGSGAAGGLGAGCMVFLNARLKSGSEAILELCGFSKHIADVDLVITGEGKLDHQSFQGKVLSGILKNAGSVPVWSICGINACDEAFLKQRGVKAFQAAEGISAEQSMANPAKYLRAAAKRAAQQYRKE